MNPAPSPNPGVNPVEYGSIFGRAVVFNSCRSCLDEIYSEALTSTRIESALSVLKTLSKDISAGADSLNDIATQTSCDWARHLDGALVGAAVTDSESNLIRQVLILLRQGSDIQDPFKRLAEGVEANCRILYREAWPIPDFAVVLKRRHPRSHWYPGDPYPVTGETQGSSVRLVISSDEFGPVAFAVLPQILIHEYVCHVPARQDGNSNTSLFAEGLMDWVAEFFHDQWIALLDADLAVAATIHSRHLREVVLSDSSHPAVRARQAGHRAAERLAVWLQTSLSPAEMWTREMAIIGVARLAICLNREEASLGRKNLFVSRLTVTPYSAEFASMLRRWFETEATVAQLLI